MSYTKLITVPLVVFSCVIISGCATTKAPGGYLPSDTETQWETFGAWITLTVTGQEKDSTVAGELIAFQDSSVYVLTKTRTAIIDCIHIKRAYLEFHTNEVESFSGWTLLGSFSTISHGFALIITFPLWLVTGISSTASESHSGKFSEQDPGVSWWENKKIYARFPQGIPKQFDLNRLKPKNYSK